MALVGLDEARIVRTPATQRIEDMAALVVPRHEIALIYGPHGTGKRTALNSWLAGQDLPVARVTLAGNESGRKLLSQLHDQVIAPDDLPERDLQDDLVEALADQPRIVVIEHTERLTAEAAGQLEWLHGRPGQQAAWILVGGPQAAKAIGKDPLLRHVRTRIRSPQTNGVVERFFGTLKYEHLYRAIIGDGNALAVELGLFRRTYNTLRPHQALDDRTPGQAYVTGTGTQ